MAQITPQDQNIFQYAPQPMIDYQNKVYVDPNTGLIYYTDLLALQKFQEDYIQLNMIQRYLYNQMQMQTPNPKEANIIKPETKKRPPVPSFESSTPSNKSKKIQTHVQRNYNIIINSQNSVNSNKGFEFPQFEMNNSQLQLQQQQQCAYIEEPEVKKLHINLNKPTYYNEDQISTCTSSQSSQPGSTDSSPMSDCNNALNTINTGYLEDNSPTSDDSQGFYQPGKKGAKIGNTKQGKRLDKLQENIDRLLDQLEVRNEEIRSICYNISNRVINHEDDCLKNRKYEALSAALIAHASRICGQPIPVKKIAKFLEVKEKTVNKIFMYLKKNIEECNSVKMPNPQLFVKKSIENLKLSKKIEEASYHILDQIRNKGLAAGQSPATIACCSVKIACLLNGLQLSHRDIAEAGEICQISLRNLYRSILPYRYEIIEDKSLFAISPQFLPDY